MKEEGAELQVHRNETLFPERPVAHNTPAECRTAPEGVGTAPRERHSFRDALARVTVFGCITHPGGHHDEQ